MNVCQVKLPHMIGKSPLVKLEKAVYLLSFTSFFTTCTCWFLQKVDRMLVCWSHNCWADRGFIFISSEILSRFLSSLIFYHSFGVSFLDERPIFLLGGPQPCPMVKTYLQRKCKWINSNLSAFLYIPFPQQILLFSHRLYFLLFFASDASGGVLK